MYLKFADSVMGSKPMYDANEGDGFHLEILDKKKLWLKVKSQKEGVLVKIPDNVGENKDITLDSLENRNDIVPSSNRKNLYLTIRFPNSQLRHFKLSYPTNSESERDEHKTIEVSSPFLANLKEGLQFLGLYIIIPIPIAFDIIVFPYSIYYLFSEYGRSFAH